MSKIVTKKFKIDGMHCTSCAMTIDFDLEDIGVVSAKTNYAKQESEVEFDAEKLTEEDIIQCISKTGYKASLQK